MVCREAVVAVMMPADSVVVVVVLAVACELEQSGEGEGCSSPVRRWDRQGEEGAGTWGVRVSALGA